MAVLLGVFGWGVGVAVDNQRVFWTALQVAVPTTAEDWLEIAYPGCPAAARWVRDQGLPLVHSLPFDDNIPVVLRMTELLYPIKVLPTAWPEMPDGAVVVVGTGDDVPMTADELFARGMVRIVRVRR